MPMCQYYTRSIDHSDQSYFLSFKIKHTYFVGVCKFVTPLAGNMRPLSPPRPPERRGNIPLSLSGLGHVPPVYNKLRGISRNCRLDSFLRPGSLVHI